MTIEKEVDGKTHPARRPTWSEAAFRARVEPAEVHLRAMRRKWASCSSRGRLTFDTDLLRQPQDFANYVIVHELLHLRVPNHGKLFKSLLLALIPNGERQEVMTRRIPFS